MAGYVTEEVRALIGTTGPRRTLRHPLGHDEIRRFAQGVMESDPIHFDARAARARGYDDVVAPPLYVLHAFRRDEGTPDPLDQLRADNLDWDGTELGAPGGLEMPEIPLKRVLNGGTQAEFFELAAVGDVISSQTRYADISEREGRSGPMVLVVFETTYTNQHDVVLARVRTTSIMR